MQNPSDDNANLPATKVQRTVRQAVRGENSEHFVKKCIITIESTAEEAICNNLSPQLLRQIIETLRNKLDQKHICLIITPASHHDGQYKLNVIDCLNNLHLGVFSISRVEMAYFQQSPLLLDYKIIFCNQHISLNTFACNANVILTIISVPQCIDTCSHFKSHQQYAEQKEGSSIKSVSEQSLQLAAEDNDSLCEAGDAISTEFNVDPPTAEQRILDLEVSVEQSRVRELIEIINNSKIPDTKDVDAFFDIAQVFHFKLYVHPVLVWRDQVILCDSNLTEIMSFYVECFLLFGHFIGRIKVDASTLNKQLNKRPSVAERVLIVSDVYDITPIPKVLIKIHRALCRFMNLEMLYDAIGIRVFNIYKRYLNICKYRDI